MKYVISNYDRKDSKLIILLLNSLCDFILGNDSKSFRDFLDAVNEIDSRKSLLAVLLKKIGRDDLQKKVLHYFLYQSRG